MSEWGSQRAGHGVTRAERGVLVRVRFGFFAEKFVGGAYIQRGCQRASNASDPEQLRERRLFRPFCLARGNLRHPRHLVEPRSRWPLERELARHVEVLGWSCSIFLLGNAEQCAVFANERPDRGDVLVLLLSRERGNQVPPDYRDLLPRPWPQIEKLLDDREVVELTGNARGLHVLLVAARTEARLQQACRESEQLRTVGLPDVFLFGPFSGNMFVQLVAMLQGATLSKTGRSHQDESYREIFETSAGTSGLSVGDVLVLLASLDSNGRPPKQYLDLLPRRWSEIEASLKNGESLEITGSVRGLNVILLATPTNAGLAQLIDDSSVFPKKVSREAAVRLFTALSAPAPAPAIEPFEETTPAIGKPTNVKYVVAIGTRH